MKVSCKIITDFLSIDELIEYRQKLKKVTIKLESYLDEKDLNKLLENMLWDSEYSYEFENANWSIK